MELHRMTVTELATSFRAGSCSPPEVLTGLFARIDHLDSALGAFTHLDRDSARADAFASAERIGADRPLSALDGIPVGVKEIFDVVGWPSTGGSLAFEGRVAETDSGLVRRLRDAGAVLIGLTRSHELALGITTQHETRGSTRNPWNLDRVPGGSSGGSGAAVAAGMVPLAVASDTSGSVRIPAAFCGVCGIRPTHGLLPLDGAVPLAPSYDAAGFIAREVSDLTLALSAVGAEVADQRSSLESLRVGIPAEPLLPMREAWADAFGWAVRILEAAGAEIVEVDLPDNELLDQASFAQIYEMVQTHTQVLATWPDKQDLLGDAMRGRLELMVSLGLGPDAGQEALQQVRQRVAGIDVDVHLAPAANRSPSPTAEPEPDSFLYDVLRSNHLQAFVGAPSVAVPAGIDGDGLPVGLQVWSRPGQDGLVLGVAAALREALRSRLPAEPPLQ